MARQRTLDAPIQADIDGDKSSYDTVRLINTVFEVAQMYEGQLLRVEWATGSVVDGVFVPIPFEGFKGVKTYTNKDDQFFAFVQKVLSQGFHALSDQIFTDLEADGVIGSGTQSDYGMSPGS